MSTEAAPALSELLPALLDPFLLVLFGYLASIVALFVFIYKYSLRPLAARHGSSFAAGRVRLWALMALLSFGSTWYYMFRFLFWSYADFVARAPRTGHVLAPLPACGRGAACLARRATALLLRMGVWLRAKSLFEEAWLYVVGAPDRWWWSAEICVFTVGTWALFLRTRGARDGIPHIWAYMLLGQAVAISVAQNMFHIALALARPPPAADAPRPGEDKPPLRARAPAARFDGPGTHLLVALLLLAGFVSVWSAPTDLGAVLVMHAGPLALALLRGRPRRGGAALFRACAAYAAALKTRTLLRVPRAADLPRALFAHPAQGSIGFDALCVALSTALYLALDPERVDARPRGRVTRTALILLTPLLGPSATFAAYIAASELGAGAEGRTSDGDEGESRK